MCVLNADQMELRYWQERDNVKTRMNYLNEKLS